MRKRYLGGRDGLLAARSDDTMVRERADAFQKTVAEYIVAADAMVAWQLQRQKALGAEVERRIAQAHLTFVGITVFNIVVAVLLGWALHRSIVQPLRSLREVAGRIAEGDLASPVPVSGRSEVADLAAAVRAMQDELRALVGQVRQASDTIRMSSQEVAAGNTDLSHRTEQAASSLQATASSMEQINGTVKQCADAAAFALMNLLGLVCDPVGGLVEVPCVYRNVGASGIAFTAADMVLSGIRCPIEPDEVILAMKEVGDALPTSLRETGEGGCAACESICKRLHHKE